MNVQENPTSDRRRWIGSLFFGGLLLVPVVADGFFETAASQRSPWLYAYIVFIGSALLLSLFSADFQLSASEVRRTIRLLGLRVSSRVLVHRSELKELRRTTTAVWEHKGALSGTQIDGYKHQVELITLDGRSLPFVGFEDVSKDPPALTQFLSDASVLLGLPVAEHFPDTPTSGPS